MQILFFFRRKYWKRKNPSSRLLSQPSTINRTTLSQEFTLELQDLFTRQTNLTLVASNGDLYFSGEITSYRIAPMSATSNQTSAQNRLTITVNVRYINTTEEDKDFEQSFSFYSDYPANSQLTGGVLESAFKEITERITQDIFNASVGKW